MYYQADMECMPKAEKQEIQLERLKKLLKRVYENIPFYRESFDKAAFDPESLASLEDLSKVPFTMKQDLRDNYPFGMFAVPREEVVRVHSSSGTTGRATVVGYTRKDLDVWGDCFARAIVSAGGDRNSVMQVSYGYGLFTGGLGAHFGGETLGCMVVPTSSGNTKRQLQIMKDFGTDILACTPSYALLLADTAKEIGVDPKLDLNIKGALLGAEPCSESLRREIEEKLACRVTDIYGLSEIMGPGVAYECEEHCGLHLNDDHFIVEIIDPQTLEVLPEGEWGEVVFTTLSKDCSPMVRYRTRDISRIIPGDCPCGRKSVRLDRISGRTDDMLILKGVNVFPSQVEEVLAGFEEVAPWYQLVVSRKGPSDFVELRVETVPEFDFDEVRHIENLQKRINAELKSNLQISVSVKVVEPKTIERSEGKAKRIIDLRKEDR